jgi:hypothetical protein
VLYHGLEVMGGGSIIAGLILGAIAVFIIERDFVKAWLSRWPVPCSPTSASCMAKRSASAVDTV